MRTTKKQVQGIFEKAEFNPCPFCGSKNIEEENEEGRGDSYWEWVECKDCGAKHKDKEAWNHRSEQSALRRAAEQAYQNEIIEPEMKQISIGKGKEWETKGDWINDKIAEWTKEDGSADSRN